MRRQAMDPTSRCGAQEEDVWALPWTSWYPKNTPQLVQYFRDYWLNEVPHLLPILSK